MQFVLKYDYIYTTVTTIIYINYFFELLFPNLLHNHTIPDSTPAPVRALLGLYICIYIYIYIYIYIFIYLYIQIYSKCIMNYSNLITHVYLHYMPWFITYEV